jgi:anti-anti-sigma factor
MVRMEIVSTADALTRLNLSGRLDLQGVHTVEAEFQRTVNARKQSAIVDLSELQFIGSLGIGMLVACAKGLGLHKATLVLVRPRTLVEEALRAVGVEHVILIARDDAHALELLGRE